MENGSSRWNEVNTSRYLWEREALAFVRDALPDTEPYRAWANVEFVGDDGTINEIDLFVVTRTGAFLIELKSHPGRISGDNTLWRWARPDNSRGTLDNPLPLTRRKCHRLESMLVRQPALRNLKGRPNLRVEPIVFLTDPDLDCQLNPAGRANVYGRGNPPKRTGAPTLPSILNLLRDTMPAGAGQRGAKHAIDTPMSRAIAEAMTQANIRPSTSDRRIGEYDLKDRLGEGEGWEDWAAVHRTSGVARRIRRWLSNEATSAKETERLNRAARREFDLLKVLRHEGIQLPVDLREDERGPALVFETSADEFRLDLWLANEQQQVDFDARLGLVRDLAEAVSHAHRKQVFHRGLGPQAVRVVRDDAGRPRLRVADWQTAARPSATLSMLVGTSHPGEMLTDSAQAYLAPEALMGDDPDPQRLDVFSVGALAYLILTGQAPAADAVELRTRLRERGGLDIAEAVDAPLEELRYVIMEATRPNVDDRLGNMFDVLAGLDAVAEAVTGAAATTGGQAAVDDPLRADAGDLLPGGWRVRHRLGKGSTALALLVERDGREEVWKVGLDPSHDERLRAEFDVLQDVKDRGIVTAYLVDSVGPRTVLHLEPAGEQTLAKYLREHGRLSLDYLERWGDDLLEMLSVLEAKGKPHRDIKPDNLGVKARRPNDELHLVLFDFSLTRTPWDNLRAGTPGYLEPFLEERPNRRWDWPAERWSVVVTLHEMATGARPRWPGGSDPAAVPGMELQVERDLFDPAVADGLAAFFTKALRRDPRQRFDTVDEMQRAWKRALASAGTTGLSGTSLGEDERSAAIAQATETTPLVELGLTPRALDALSRLNLHTVGDLSNANLVTLQRLRGVGDKTRREIARVGRAVQERFTPQTDEADLDHVTAFSIDRLYSLLLPKDGPLSDATVLRMLLEPRAPAQLTTTGHDEPLPEWPGIADVARTSGLGRSVVTSMLERATSRWKRIPPFGQLRADLHALLTNHGGVMAVDELVAVALTVRGAVAGAARTDRARAVVRAVIEYDNSLTNSQWVLTRRDDRLVVADDTSDVVEGMAVGEFALDLGDAADELAAADPLPSTAAVVARLREVVAPDGFPALPEARLIRLAAACSMTAATSSRLDLYPRGLSAERAISLARPVLLGSGTFSLSEEAVHQRVLSRFPEAAPLPRRPQLDVLLRALGLEWVESGTDGGYRLPAFSGSSMSMISPSTRMTPSTAGQAAFDDAQQLASDFSVRIQRLCDRGGFCALTVWPAKVEVLEHRLAQQFGAVIVSVDDVLLATMHREADRRKIAWANLLKADANPDSADWNRLLTFVNDTMPQVCDQLLSAGPVVVLTSAGLLARYQQMRLLDQLRNHADGTVRIADTAVTSVLLIVPTDQPDAKPMLGDVPVPVIESAHWKPVPSAWLQDRTLAPTPPTADSQPGIG